jgi:RsiW-degrading membrane proteinase PrsW (M82 family)
MVLLTIALIPVVVFLVYVYFRDKYEKEPIGLLLRGLLAGALVTIPIVFVEQGLSAAGSSITGLGSAAYTSFVVAGFTEELFKFLAVMIIFWRRKEFNERFDGIVYAVFISLGFAAVENIMYVLDQGSTVGIVRSLTAVPAHLLFGVTMGYYLGLSRFMSENRNYLLFNALAVPILLHGIYDFMILSQHPLGLWLFIPFIIYLWRTGLKKMKLLSAPGSAPSPGNPEPPPGPTPLP